MRSLPGLRAVTLRAPLILVTLLAVSAMAGVLAGHPTVAFADAPTGRSDAQKIAFFEDIVIGPGEVWDNVVVFGGDVLVHGTLEGVLVVVGGDLVVGSRAVLGAAAAPGDAALVSVFGDVVVEPGGTVAGRTIDVAGTVAGALRSAFVDPVMRPWSPGAVIGWIWSTIMLLLFGVVVAAIAPRQLAAVGDRVKRRPFSSLGWGALGMVIVVPIATAALVVTIVGLILIVPWVAIGLPALSVFGLTAIGVMIGQAILRGRGHGRGEAIAAAVIGLSVISVLRWIPVGGAVLFFLLWLAGCAATYVSMWVWLRNRRLRKLPSPADRSAGEGASGA